MFFVLLTNIKTQQQIEAMEQLIYNLKITTVIYK